MNLLEKYRAIVKTMNEPSDTVKPFFEELRICKDIDPVNPEVMNILPMGHNTKDKDVPSLNQLMNHKGEVIKELEKMNIRDIANMPLETFTKANMTVKVASEVLGEDILFVSNDEIAKGLKDEGLVVYTAQELKAIVKLNPDPEALKRIHEVKQVFKGSEVIQ